MSGLKFREMQMNNIRRLRVSRGMKQADLAAVLNVAQGTLSYWEQGKYDIDNKSLIKLAEYFSVTTDYLLGKTDSPEGSNRVSNGSSNGNANMDEEFDSLEFAFFDEYKELSEEHKQVLRHMAKVLKEMDGKDPAPRSE